MTRRLLPVALIPILVVWLAATSRPAAQTGFDSLQTAEPGSASEQRTGAPTVAAETAEVGVAKPRPSARPHPSSKLGDWSCSDPPLCGETPQPRIVDGPSIAGTASWYRYIPGGAAAGPALRRFLGPHWRGGIVRVCAGETCIVAQLSDWCQCSTGAEKLIDLDAQLFAALAPLSQGVVNVEVRAIRD